MPVVDVRLAPSLFSLLLDNNCPWHVNGSNMNELFIFIIIAIVIMDLVL